MPPPADAIIPVNPGDGEARRRTASAFARLAQSGKPLLLFVTHARGGGVARHVRELAALLEPAADVLVLRAHRRSFVALEGEGGHRDARLWFHREDDWPSLCAFLRELGLARIHYHHVQGLPARVLELGREVGCPWDVTVHDYYPLCPQYQLTDASGRYCGEPDEAGCARCLAASPAQWPMGIAQWRAAFGRLLGDAGRVIAPSSDAAARIARHFPAVSPLVWPHVETGPSVVGESKVLVLGGLSPSKGMDLVTACARDARARGLRLHFRVIGHIARPVDGEAGLPMSFTGEYPEGALDSLIQRERGDAVLFPAQWPETWSYTLTAAIDSGLPILASDLGAFPERLAGRDGARILPWNEKPSRFNDALTDMLRASDAAPAEPAAREFPGAYRNRYMQDVAARPPSASEPAIAPPGLAVAPDEWVPQPTLIELFDDGVRCGNGRSTAMLRERVAQADHELGEAQALHERLDAAGTAQAQGLARIHALESELAASRDECTRQAARAESAARQAAALESSTSWRLTAPLRALARLLLRR